ncbi:MAG: Hsp20/alpha crystallin family protein [Acidobacteria bacterium]|nr:Hsp20/alpha crystallin family protein [Acidobacteriota bacterium]MCA1600438.1 Hsp20/alpha crystallin family protein [Acidobacteriota bacterium]
MSKQWNPLQDLMLLQDRMNRLFEDATERRARVDAETSDDIETAEWYPTADVYDHDGECLIVVDLPGIDRSALEITIDDNRLTIKGTRAVETSTSRTERPTGRFLRTFSLPGSVDQKSINAAYKDGVLEVRLPKRKEEMPKRIEIKVS